MTSNRIIVHVVDYQRKHLVLRWKDPVSSKLKTQSSKTSKKREAHLAADALEAELNAKQPRGDGLIAWADFVDVYTDDHLMSLSRSGRNRSLGVLNVFDIEMDPATLSDATTSSISSYATKLRKSGRSESTIAVHMRTLRAALGWATKNGHLGEMPTLPKQARAKGSRAKGRPLTDKEFVTFLRAVRLQEDLKRLDRPARRTWRRLLIGLWLSGLRLDEALRLSWDQGSFILDSSGKYPIFIIREQKSGNEQTLPLTPDFGRWILKTPEQRRVGFVFPLAKERQARIRRMDTTSKTISAIGEKSGVLVNSQGKFASAHDLRRSFGLRWASNVMPAELQALMRHSNIGTTMSFYALVSAQSFAEKLWKGKNK